MQRFKPSTILGGLIELRKPDGSIRSPETFRDWLEAAWRRNVLTLNGTRWQMSDSATLEAFRWIVARHSGSSDELYEFLVNNVLGEGYAATRIVDLARLLCGISTPGIAVDYIKFLIEENHLDDFLLWQDQEGASRADDLRMTEAKERRA